jgi:hypothetical protein
MRRRCNVTGAADTVMQQTFGDGMVARNDRIELSWWFFF